MPYLKTIQLSGYCGFADTQLLDFAIPDPKSPGSGLTCLVGPNAGGKSAVLEAIHRACHRNPIQLERSVRNVKTRVIAGFTVEWNDGLTRTLKSDPQNNALISAQGKQASKFSEREVYFLPSNRSLSEKLQLAAMPRGQFLETMKLGKEREFETFHPWAGRIRKACIESEQFKNMLNRMIDYDVDLSSDNNELHVRVSGSDHRPVGMGRGLISVLFLCDALYDAPAGSVIVIDEPELSLHPAWQRRIMTVLIEESQRCQIIYATHSPYFVDWSALVAGARIARVYRGSSGGCRISQPSAETIRQTEGFLADINNPHVLGITGREAFFLPDGVVLVEGQEDVLCYQAMVKSLGLPFSGSFYGWGVGGAGNMGTFATLFRELGYTHVAGILDGDKQQDRAKLEKKFPEYRFVCASTENVRDREAVCGLCSSNGTIHDEHREEVTRLFGELEDYLKG